MSDSADEPPAKRRCIEKDMPKPTSKLEIVDLVLRSPATADDKDDYSEIAFRITSKKCAQGR